MHILLIVLWAIVLLASPVLVITIVNTLAVECSIDFTMPLTATTYFCILGLIAVFRGGK